MGEVMLYRINSRIGYVFMDRQIYVCIEFNGQFEGASKDHDILIMLTLKGAWPPSPRAIGDAFNKQADTGRELCNQCR